ncbi:ImmA/IrrE family metallo-endopeptidase [Isosphaeraceae bacterium EP7]
MAGSKPMDDRAIEAYAASILKAHGLYKLPVDPFEIAKNERIRLAPGIFGGRFDARLEFHRKKGRFLLLYADKRTGRTEGRIHFTIGHELGHYYLEEHKEYLLSGLWHGSHTGFVSDNRLEREADRFSAGLLMPADLFRTAVARFRQRVCTLRDLITLSERLGTSITATVRRYCELDIEASSVVLAREGVVLFHVASYDMQSLGYRFVRHRSRVPQTSKTARLLVEGSDEFSEGKIEADVWYENRRGTLWEEAQRLGNTGLTLTYMVHDSDH